nr:hypothetical protein [uncultured Flavobacterium sp.]
MKKLLYLFSASLLVLTSCSNNDNDSSGITKYILPKTIKYTTPTNPVGYLYTFVYNGNKLVSVTHENIKTDYTYDGNVIVGVKNVQYEKTYTYANNKLAMATYTSLAPTKEKKVYTYNSDGTITEDKYDINTTTLVESKMGTTVLTLVNGNLVKLYRTYSPTDPYTFEYVYDSKNSPFKNILGLNLLLVDSNGGFWPISDLISLNNNATQSIYYSSTETRLYIKIDYVYNKNGYPTKATIHKNGDVLIVEYTY